jgi:hypothetical protein
MPISIGSENCGERRPTGKDWETALRGRMVLKLFQVTASDSTLYAR